MRQSVADSTGKSRKVVDSYQPVWMSHWMRTSSSPCRTEELDHVSRDDASRFVREPRKTNTKTVDVVNQSLRLSSKVSGNEGKCAALTKHGQDIDNMQAIKPMSVHKLEPGKAIKYRSGVSAANETSFGLCHSLGEGTSKTPLEWMRSDFSATERKFSRGTYVGSSTHIVPYCDKGKAAAYPVISKPPSVSNNQSPQVSMRMLEQERCRKHSQSVDLVCERKTDSHSESDTSMNACVRERKTTTSFLFDAPSTNENRLSSFSRDWFQKMQNCSAITLLPSQHDSLEKTESKKSFYDRYPVQKLPSCVHDLETMRICTTVDSVQASPGGCPRFSQTTHSMLITKKTDVNLLKENEIFKTAGLITKMEGNRSDELHSLSPFFASSNRGVKLQPLNSFSNSEGKSSEEVRPYKVTIKNESSAETDTMDMDFFKQEKLNSGTNSTPSTKGFNIDSNSSPPIEFASSREEARRRWGKIGTPDINLQLPALPAVASSSDNVCPSSSRTQSLEMDILLAHADHPKPKSNEVDPTNRWVKRLKLTSSTNLSASRGTKSSSLGEKLSHDKMTKFFRSILENSLTDKPDNKREEGDFILDPANKGKKLLLTHAWVKRWLRNEVRGTREKADEAVVAREPKLMVCELEKKQFPSIGAMALMGKAMNGLQSCEVEKKGPFTVWNTKAF